MHEIDIGELQEGVPLSWHIRFDEHFIVLSKYFIPTTQDIKRIRRFDLAPLYKGKEAKPPAGPKEREAVYEPPAHTMQGPSVLSEEKPGTYGALVSYLSVLFSACRNRIVSLGIIRKAGLLVTGFVLKNKEKAILEVARGSKKNRLSSHSLNTGILTVLLASSANVGGKQLIEAVCGAIMHDIGILLLNVDNPMEAVETHTLHGGRYLKSIGGCSATIFMPAFQHHEKADGSGYPAGLALNDIPTITRIVTICDSCDSHTSYIRFGEDISMHLKKEDLFIWKKSDFDIKLFTVLTGELFKTVKEGRRVLLNDGTVGIIAKPALRFPVTPVVKPVTDSGPAEPIELLKTGDIWIERFL